MRNVLAIACARMTSTRLPGKTSKQIGSVTVLEAILHRLEQSDTIRKIVLATPRTEDNGPLWETAENYGIPVVLGPEDNVVARMELAVDRFYRSGDLIYRALIDQPLLDWASLDMDVRLMQTNNWDFIRPLAFNESPVYGAGADVWSYRCWHAISENSKKREREHPGMWLYRNMERWDYGLVDYPHWMYRPYRFELDTAADLELMNRLYAAWMVAGDLKTGPIPLKWAVQYMDNNPGLQSVNSHIVEKTGPYTSFTKAEIATWVKDYSNREIVWAEVGLRGSIQEVNRRTLRCFSCGGGPMSLRVHKGRDLVTDCARCGEKRTFYSKR